MTARTYTADELLAQVAWVREFAGALVADPNAADDVSQEALAAALDRRPPDVRSLRGWLATVARNALRQWRRSESRRARREERVAASEAIPSSHELIERAAAQRAVVGAVLDLPEPYRTTVLLRFFEGLSPAAIGARDGVPVATVYTRLSRALEKLRAHLDRRLLAALLPWPSTPWLGSPAALGGAVVNAKVVVAAAAVVAVGFWFLSSDGARKDAAPPEGTAAVAAAKREPAAAAAPEAAAARLGAESVQRGGAAAQLAAATAPASSEPATRRLSGRVLDLDARGVGGVDVRVVPMESRDAEAPLAIGRTEIDGRFSIQAPIRESRIEVASPRWVTVLAGWGAQSADGDRILVVAPAIAVGGTVRDEAGEPIDGATVEVRPPAQFRSTFREILDLSVDRAWSTHTDASGRFDLAQAPQIPMGELRASRAGFAAHEEPSPQASAFRLAIVLRRELAAEGSVAGRVVGAAGEPIAGARVSAGERPVLTGDDGRFVLAVGASRTVTAAKAGFQPATANAPWPDALVLRLVEPARSVRGIVVDASGKAVPRALVWVRDATWFAMGEDAIHILESVLAGRSGAPFVTCDSEGRFEMPGLVARSYGFGAGDPRTLRIGNVEGIPAGATDVRIAIPEEPIHDRIMGRVVARTGEPIAGVRVNVFRRAFELPLPGGRGWTRQGISKAPATTDADGRFEIRDVLRADVGLDFEGQAIIPDGRSAPFGDDPVDLRVELLRRCHMKVELEDASDAASRFAVLDGSGNALEIQRWEGESVYGDDTGPIRAGRSSVVAVAESARTVVLYRGNSELRRVPVELKPGPPTIVR
ncbi:MAG TPA: sigma-70 family RNA polymerase sigma factor [Planctomycetota bacterium]|nr:sigma-70 family RNA polymerase sigma factor [Planctomycetota bacterium]